MNDLAAERLRDIEARAEAAQVGPWRFKTMGYSDSGVAFWSLGNADDPVKHPVADFAAYGEPDETDRAFIANARSDIPFLLALVRRREQEAAEREQALRAARDLVNDALFVLGGELKKKRGKVDTAIDRLAKASATLEAVLSVEPTEGAEGR